MKTISLRSQPLITLWLLVALLLWDVSGLDLTMARWFGDAQGFALSEHWLLTKVLHSGVRSASWLLALGLTLCVWWPVGLMRKIGVTDRIQLSVTAIASVLVVSSLKGFSQTSCPWELHDFGGLARYVSHWSWGAHGDGGSGHCFPAGHASSGFAFIGGYFAFRKSHPQLARVWLTLTLLAGLAFGFAQQIRGAHFMSHTLWTGYLCWCVAAAIDGFRHRSARRLHTGGSASSTSAEWLARARTGVTTREAIAIHDWAESGMSVTPQSD